MIGDWVRLRYTDRLTGEEVVKNFQVGQLRYTSWEGRGETLYVGSDHQNMGYVEQIEPIPLTQEILEKNGFRCTPAKGEMMICGKTFEIWVDFNEKRCWVSIQVPAPVKSELRLSYYEGYMYSVHERQHALRLCGIEKEIEL